MVMWSVPAISVQYNLFSLALNFLLALRDTESFLRDWLERYQLPVKYINNAI